MRRWYLPLTVFGVGSLSVLLVSARGREVVRWAMDRLEDAPERLMEWNEAAQLELDRLQAAVNHLAESLGRFETAR